MAQARLWVVEVKLLMEPRRADLRVENLEFRAYSIGLKSLELKVQYVQLREDREFRASGLRV